MNTMKKTELNDKLNEIKAKIKANSKDAHFADALIGDLLSVKGQIDHEPAIVHLPVSDIEESADGEHFEVMAMKDGTAVYHTRGGYTIIADYRIAGLNSNIRSLIAYTNGVDALTHEDKELADLEASANAYVLNIPMLAASDAKFKLEMATAVVKYLNDTYESAMNAPLQPDDIKANDDYEAVAKMTEYISESTKAQNK